MNVIGMVLMLLAALALGYAVCWVISGGRRPKP